jgi:hypothetical protein
MYADQILMVDRRLDEAKSVPKMRYLGRVDQTLTAGQTGLQLVLVQTQMRMIVVLVLMVGKTWEGMKSPKMFSLAASRESDQRLTE